MLVLVVYLLCLNPSVFVLLVGFHCCFSVYILVISGNLHGVLWPPLALEGLELYTEWPVMSASTPITLNINSSMKACMF